MGVSIPEKEFLERIRRTQKAAKIRDLDAFLIFSHYQEREGHICYLVNHHISFPNAWSHRGFGFSALLLTLDGLPTLVSPMGYQKEIVVNIEDAKTGLDMVTDIVSTVMERKLSKAKIGIVGSDVVPLEYITRIRQELPRVTFEASDDILENLRMVKSSREIDILKEAAKVADEGLRAGIEAVGDGVPEYKVALACINAGYDAGADFIARVRVISSPTPVSALLWPLAARKKIRRGDIVYIDYIGWYKKYAFDVSRITVAGTPTSPQKDFLNALVDATDWMVKTVKPGSTTHYRVYMNKDREVTPFGHGIGIEVCEKPWILPDTKLTFKPKMVLCIEPNVSIPKVGSLSLEEEVVVTDSGVEVITSCSIVNW